jgi:transposase
VSENNPVRAIDAYVTTLDLVGLHIQTGDAGLTAGQPAFHPGLLIKLYLYGYINGIRSSRKLEREASRSLEVIWLADNLKPSYKTIANFRKDNSTALTAINKDFVLLCRHLNLFKGMKSLLMAASLKRMPAKTASTPLKSWQNNWRNWTKKLLPTSNNWPNKIAVMTRLALGAWLTTKAWPTKLNCSKRSRPRKKACKTNWWHQPTHNCQQLTGMPGC